MSALTCLHNSCTYDLTRLGVRVARWTRTHFCCLYTICSSSIAQLKCTCPGSKRSWGFVHYPGKQEVMDSNPTCRADKFFHFTFLPLFLTTPSLQSTRREMRSKNSYALTLLNQFLPHVTVVFSMVLQCECLHMYAWHALLATTHWSTRWYWLLFTLPWWWL